MRTHIGTAVALGLPDAHLHAPNAEMRRRDETLRQFDGLPVVCDRAALGRCSSTSPRSGLDCVEFSDASSSRRSPPPRLRGWGGEVADRHVRVTFSNEPVERLALLGTRVRAALAAVGNRT